MTPRILVIIGSTRQGRYGEHVARWLMRHLIERHDAEYELVDLRDYPLPFFDSPTPPKTGRYEPQALPWAEKVASGDAYIVVTPEYNRGYPAVLKNALDHLYREWNRKPIAFVSYGASSAGYRATEQLRAVAEELEMIPIREQVGIPFVWRAVDEYGVLRQGDAVRATTQMVDNLLWWTRALNAARAADQVEVRR